MAIGIFAIVRLCRNAPDPDAFIKELARTPTSQLRKKIREHCDISKINVSESILEDQYIGSDGDLLPLTLQTQFGHPKRGDISTPSDVKTK